MVKIICQYTGLEFEATSKRQKNHPEISKLLNEAAADKRNPGAYGIVKKALAEGRTRDFTTVREFIEFARSAVQAGAQEQADQERRNRELREEQARKREEAEARRKVQNARLREHGYLWSREYRDHDEFEEGEPSLWVLRAPDGRAVSPEQGLDEIERGAEVVQEELAGIILSGGELPYQVVLDGQLKEAADRRDTEKKAQKEAKEKAEIEAWEAARKPVEAMVEVEPFDYSGFELIYDWSKAAFGARFERKVYRGEINGTPCGVIYSYSGGHDYFEWAAFYCEDPEQTGLTPVKRDEVNQTLKDFFGG